MNNWKERTLDKVIDIIIDHRGLTPKKLGGDWADFGYRAISAKSIKNGQLVNEDQMNLLPEDLYKRWMKDEIQYGDILLTSEAPLGEHLIWKSNEKIVLSQRIFGIRTNHEKLDPFFFNYFIDSKFYQHQLKSRESGSTVTGIRQSELLKTKVLLPPIEQQKEIATVLSSLDDKIELLRNENETLEKIAQTIFKEWFVNFTINGEKLKLKNGIPEGWKVGKLKDILNDVKKSLKPGFDLRGRIYVPIDEIPMKRLGLYSLAHINQAKSSLIAFEPGDILFGAMRCYFHRVNFSTVKGVTRTTVMVLRPKQKILFEYGLFLMNMEKTVDYASQHSKGTTMPYAVWNNTLEDMMILIPEEKYLKQFSCIAKNILDQISNNINQICSLSSMRDTLLPKLMSGEISIND